MPSRRLPARRVAGVRTGRAKSPRLIKARKCVGEFKFTTGKPGHIGIRYDIDGEDIINMDIPSNTRGGPLWDGWKFDKHSRENLNRLTPHTRNNRKLKIVFIIRKDYPDGSIILKAVLEDRESGLFSLITSMNEQFSKKYEGRTLKVTDSKWTICWTNMSAPAMFWEEFQNRLLF
tara:strand:- start:216 stop:740 length:525 start_codon:yes stop_codon:yes gene_type:complete